MNFDEQMRRAVRADARRFQLGSLQIKPRSRGWFYAVRAAELTAALAAAVGISVLVASARQEVGSPTPPPGSTAQQPKSSATQPGTLTSPTPSAACALGSGGLQACPARGPVGTVVTLSDQNWGCTAGRRGFAAILVFEGHPESGAGTEGAVSLPEVQPNDDGTFRITFVVPPTLEPFHGQGGGQTRPGTYAFVGRPPDCTVLFVVTP